VLKLCIFYRAYLVLSTLFFRQNKTERKRKIVSTERPIEVCNSSEIPKRSNTKKNNINTAHNAKQGYLKNLQP
jgi:hypothetical protein